MELPLRLLLVTFRERCKGGGSVLVLTCERGSVRSPHGRIVVQYLSDAACWGFFVPAACFLPLSPSLIPAGLSALSAERWFGGVLRF